MQAFCVCKDCRPRGMKLREAIRQCERVALVVRVGVERADQIEADKRERLAALSRRAR